MILVNPEDRRFFNDCIVLVLLLGELVLYERAKQMIALRNSVACAGLEISNTYISISKKQKSLLNLGLSKVTINTLYLT